MIKKRPKDCPHSNEKCILENTAACMILTKLRRDGGECCKGNWDRKFPDPKQAELDILRGGKNDKRISHNHEWVYGKDDP